MGETKDTTLHENGGEQGECFERTDRRRVGGIHFRTTYYKDSAARFCVSKEKTYFATALVGGAAYILWQILFREAAGPFAYLKISLAVVLLLVYYRNARIRYQSVLILYGIGIQLETGFLLGTSRTFIEKSKIFSTVIYDKMTYTELIPCIGIVVEDEKSLILPFSEFRVPMEENVLVYNALKMI